MNIQSNNHRPLQVHERFFSWQGEGVHMGRAAFFIRLYGCPVHCPWCDSAGTWHPDFTPTDIARMLPEQLADEAVSTKADFAVITGGEPAIHDLGPLTSALRRNGIRRHIETSGAFPIQGEFNWITVSPKWGRLPIRVNLRIADELKIIVETPDSITHWIEWIGEDMHADHVWLHPEWSQRNNPNVLNAIGEAVKTLGSPFRAGYQIHKLFKIDEQDPRSRPPVPLGGKDHACHTVDKRNS